MIVKTFSTSGRPIAFLVEQVRDLGGGVSRSPELEHAVAQRCVITQLLIAHDWAPQHVLRFGSPRPSHRHVSPLSSAPAGDYDPFYQQSYDLLAVLDGGSCCMPDSRYVGG